VNGRRRLQTIVAAAAVALALPVVGSTTTARNEDEGRAPAEASIFAVPGTPASLQGLAPCTSGAHTLAHFGARVYPEMGNGGYVSVHTDVHLAYDAATNTFLPAPMSS
jgi:hypothetical protein